MTNNVTSVMQPRAGLCPHGMPPSACPICSNMGGGGKRTEFNFKSSKLPMMSWNQCEAIGYFLKAQRRASEKQRLNFKLLTLQIQLLADKFGKMAAKMSEFAAMFSHIPGGIFISLPVRLFLILPLQLLQNTFSKVVDISDKIAAIFGEMLKGLETAKEKLNEFIKEIKNKFFKLFELFGAENNNEKNRYIEDDKKIFNFNRFLRKLRRRQKEDDNET